MSIPSKLPPREPLRPVKKEKGAETPEDRLKKRGFIRDPEKMAGKIRIQMEHEAKQEKAAKRKAWKENPEDTKKRVTKDYPPTRRPPKFPM